MPWELTGNPDGDIGPNNFLGTRANDPLRIRTRSSVNNADAMTITPAPDAATTGNVGIGTMTPRSRFQLKSLTAIDEGATAAGAWANFGSNAFYDGAWKRIDTTKAGVNFHINPDPAAAGQEFRFLRVEADGSRLRNLAVIGSTTSFIAEGNVGIGTTNPTTATGGRVLHIDNPAGASALRLGNGAPSGQQWEWQSTVINGVGAMNLSKLTPPLANPLTVFADGSVEVTGDIRLLGADCAEYFEVKDGAEIESGTVLVIDEDSTLHECEEEYDKRVAGVVSGAGGLRPGIVLDNGTEEVGVPVALTGKVYCKVDAEYSPVEVGDSLTTSSTRGYARKAIDSTRCRSSILGKALAPLTEGCGLIPVLVALQ